MTNTEDQELKIKGKNLKCSERQSVDVRGLFMITGQIMQF